MTFRSDVYSPKRPSTQQVRPLPLKSPSPLFARLLDGRPILMNRRRLSLSLFLSPSLSPSHVSPGREADAGTSSPSNTSYLSYLLRAVLSAASKEIFCVVCQASD